MSGLSRILNVLAGEEVLRGIITGLELVREQEHKCAQVVFGDLPLEELVLALPTVGLVLVRKEACHHVRRRQLQANFRMRLVRRNGD